MTAKEMKQRLECVPDDFEIETNVKVRENFVTVITSARKGYLCYLIRAETVNMVEYHKERNT